MQKSAKDIIKKYLPSPVFDVAKRVKSSLTQQSKPVKPAYDQPTVIVDDFGIKFIYYPWESSSLADLKSRDFYKPEFFAIKKLISKGSTVLDIGANVGLHSAYISKIIGNTGRVYAFEPVPNTYWMMQETLVLNRVENVTSAMMALGNKNATLKMNIFEEKYSAWSTFGSPHFDDIRPIGSVDVATTTLDSYCKENSIGHIDFLKIDVEGFERDVLEGAKDMLTAGKISSLSFEISQIPLEGAGGTAKDVFDILHTYGYKAYKFNVEKDAFEGPFDDSSDFYENYYASRRDLAKNAQ